MTAGRPLRVAMLIQRYLPHVGGAERQLASLAPLLAERGVEVRVFTRRIGGLARSETLDGTEVRRIAVPGPKPVASIAYTGGVVVALAAWRPDVVHAHELLSPATSALAAKALYGVPVVAKVLRGGALGDVAKLRASANGRRRLRAIVRGVDAFAVLSQEIDAELALGGVPRARRRAIPNGVDVGRFAPAPAPMREAGRRRLGVADGAFVAIYCGRLVPEKRVDLLLRAWGTLTPAGKLAIAPQLWIVGDGPERAALEASAGPSVRFFGSVEEVGPLLRLADAFVLPSDTEGLSNAMLEGMAAGLPVVATRVGAAQDLLGPRAGVAAEAGLLVPAGDADALGRALATLAADRATRRRLGAEARRRAEHEFALPAVADSLVALYRELLRRPPAASPRAARRAGQRPGAELPLPGSAPQEGHR